jgi:hypothetical protein
VWKTKLMSRTLLQDATVPSNATTGRPNVVFQNSPSLSLVPTLTLKEVHVRILTGPGISRRSLMIMYVYYVRTS